MKKFVLFSVFLSVFVFCTVPAYPETHYQYVYDLKADVYFGHISYTEVKYDGEDPTVLREGKTAAEVAVLNFPITAGDTIRTSGSRRCEIQFDTGTIVRLDTDTELKVETILAQSLSSQFKLTNLVLHRGQIYVMYKEYKSVEVLQVLTTNASTKLKHNTVLLMRSGRDGSTDVKVKSGQASLLYGPDESNLEKIKLEGSQEVTVSAENQILYTEYEREADFDLWNENLNKNFMALHEGYAVLPKPIQRMSPAVFYFAQKYANVFGDWVWNDIYGYVWRPFYNDRYPSGDWKPYYYGQWREINGTLFWVPQESWGWVPYHLGVWVWDKNLGWLWIPGSAFAPAWADWNFYMGHFAWRPYSLWDWYFSSLSYDYHSWFPFSSMFQTGAVDPETGRILPLDEESSPKTLTLTKVNKSQLKKRGTAPYKPPKVMRKALYNLAKSIEKGETQILESMQSIPNPIFIVDAERINAPQIQGHIRTFNQLDSQTQEGILVRNPLKDFSRTAARAFRRGEIITDLGKNLVVLRPEKSATEDIENVPFPGRDILTGLSSPLESPSKETRSEARFRDWNPDIGQALHKGVTISYSSKYNMIQCPELGLSSFNVNVRGGTSPRGGFYQPTASGSSSGGSVSASSASSSSGESTSGTVSSSSAKSSTSSSSSSGSASAKTIKK